MDAAGSSPDEDVFVDAEESADERAVGVGAGAGAGVAVDVAAVGVGKEGGQAQVSPDDEGKTELL